MGTELDGMRKGSEFLLLSAAGAWVLLFSLSIPHPIEVPGCSSVGLRREGVRNEGWTRGKSNSPGGEQAIEG